jgi:hypothetical protein
MSEPSNSTEYAPWLGTIKAAIRDAGRLASLRVHLALISLCCRTGREINER